MHCSSRDIPILNLLYALLAVLDHSPSLITESLLQTIMHLRVRNRNDNSSKYDIYQVLAQNNEVLDIAYQEAWDVEMSQQNDAGLSKKAFQVYIQYPPPESHGRNARDILTVEFPNTRCSYVFQTVHGVAQWYFVPLTGFNSKHDLPTGLKMARNSFFETLLAPITTSIFNGLAALLHLRSGQPTCDELEPRHKHYILKILVDMMGQAPEAPFPTIGTHTMHYVCGTVDFAWLICVLCGLANGNGASLTLANGEKDTTYAYGYTLLKVSDIDWPGVGKAVPLRPLVI